MKQHKFLHRVFSLVLCLVLTCGLVLSAHAADFQLPFEYWALQNAWTQATETKDMAQIITVAEQTYQLLIPYGFNSSICGILEPRAIWAALACEAQGDLDGAITWLKRHQAIAQWLDDNGTDRSDTLMNIPPRLAFLEDAAAPAIYALADSTESAYACGPKHGTWFGSADGGSKNGESAVLAYISFLDGYSVEYWLDYKKSHYPKFNSAATQGGVIELAWNFSPENTDSVRKVLDPANDAYINDGLKAMSELNATVLLRVGAEMNVWTAGCDPTVFKQAFQKIATEAKKYSNIQMVFSPNDVGGRNQQMTDYYPGDEYVDWIGMSTYHNNGTWSCQDYAATPEYSLNNRSYIYNDAFYGLGVYTGNPVVVIRPIMELAAAHNKPVMISECGFSYQNKTQGTSQSAFAADQLTKFYSYINMIYPQVKAVFYFDVDINTSSWLYTLAGDAAVNSAYDAAVSNGSYLAFGQTQGLNWTPLEKTSYQTADGKLKLATYALIPGTKDAATSVSYLVDGKQVATVSTAPYIYELNAAGLSAGEHTIQALATCTDGTRKVLADTASYTITVTADGYITGKEGAARPAQPTAHASTQTVKLDGKDVTFYVYQIAADGGNGSNYIKLRDLACALNGTAAQFEVDYDHSANCITLTGGQSYTVQGGEMEPNASGDQPCQPGNSALLVNGEAVQPEVYTINGYNYFKLRDLGRALDFNVSYIDGGIVISSSEPYSDAQ